MLRWDKCETHTGRNDFDYLTVFYQIISDPFITVKSLFFFICAVHFQVIFSMMSQKHLNVSCCCIIEISINQQ